MRLMPVFCVTVALCTSPLGFADARVQCVTKTSPPLFVASGIGLALSLLLPQSKQMQCSYEDGYKLQAYCCEIDEFNPDLCQADRKEHCPQGESLLCAYFNNDGSFIERGEKQYTELAITGASASLAVFITSFVGIVLSKMLGKYKPRYERV